MTPLSSFQKEFLLFLPDKVAEVALEIKTTVTERLLKRNIEAFDWHLQDLWRVAVYYTLSDSPIQSLAYYHKLLQWTESDPQAHHDALCGTAHVFAAQKQYQDALSLFQLALSKGVSPGKIPFFMARISYLMGNRAQALQWLTTFLGYYKETNTLHLHALSMSLMLNDQRGHFSAARQCLEEVVKKYPTWESHFMAASFSPYLPFTRGINDTTAVHKEALQKKTCYENSQSIPLFAWFLPHFYKRLSNPAASEAQALYKQLLHAIQQRMHFWASASPALSVSPLSTSAIRIAIVGDFTAVATQALNTLLVKMCRQHSVTLFGSQAFPLDLSEEHWLKTVILSDDIPTAYTQVKSHQPHIILYLHHAHSPKQLTFLSNERIAPYQGLWATEPGILADPRFIDEVLVYQKTTPTEPLPAELQGFTVTPLPGDPVKKSAQPEHPIPLSAFNLKPDQHYYFCPFNLTELHPQFFAHCDALLQQDPLGNIFFLASDTPEGERSWRVHIQDTYPQTAERMHILPPLNRVSQAAVAQHVDVLIDPPYVPLKHLWWQYLSLGTPIIGFERDSWNGNWVNKLYESMQWQGLSELQHLDPVAQAIHVATHPEIKAGCQRHVQEYAFDFQGLETDVLNWFNEKVVAQSAQAIQ